VHTFKQHQRWNLDSEQHERNNSQQLNFNDS
jgi:hypothetical protein